MTYSSASVDLGISSLCACARFQTLTGTATPTEALSHVVKVWSGAPENNAGQLGMGRAADGDELDLTVPTYAVVGMTALNYTVGGVSYWDAAGAVAIRLYLPKVNTGEDPGTAAMRATSDAGEIAEQIQAQVAAGTSFADADIQVEGPFMDEEGAFRSMTIFEITITFRG